ncbi:MAG: hypothetical protein ABF545_00535 [Bifidobacterium psychraerophilum]|uniref:hypothetical protein n=1 Tax=Bifidobacterium psychraerophilum TaxID=218140 RepID=UPI0039EC31AB
MNDTTTPDYERRIDDISPLLQWRAITDKQETRKLDEVEHIQELAAALDIEYRQAVMHNDAADLEYSTAIKQAVTKTLDADISQIPRPEHTDLRTLRLKLDTQYAIYATRVRRLGREVCDSLKARAHEQLPQAWDQVARACHNPDIEQAKQTLEQARLAIGDARATSMLWEQLALLPNTRPESFSNIMGTPMNEDRKELDRTNLEYDFLTLEAKHRERDHNPNDHGLLHDIYTRLEELAPHRKLN